MKRHFFIKLSTFFIHLKMRYTHYNAFFIKPTYSNFIFFQFYLLTCLFDFL